MRKGKIDAKSRRTPAKNAEKRGRLTSPKLPTFMKCIARYNAKQRLRPLSLLKRFRLHFGEEAVIGALVRARDNYVVKGDVEKLEAQLLKSWLASDVAAEDVFKSLKIDDSGSMDFFDQQVGVLENFIKSTITRISSMSICSRS